MASVEGSKSLQRGSDQMFDNICGPCNQDNVENGANHYCIECGEYLCGQCKDYHRKLPVTRNHKIVPGSKIPTTDTGSQESGLVIYCGCNKNQEVEFYCEGHEVVVCNLCKNINHYKCKTVRIEEKSTNYTSAELNSVLSKTKSIKDKFEQLKQEVDDAVRDLKLSKEACKKEIHTFRKDLDDFLNKLEHDLLSSLDNCENKHQKQLQDQIVMLTSVIQMLDADYKFLENAKRDDRKSVMFTSDVHVSKSLNDYEIRLYELENNVRKPTLSFEKNKKLDDVQSEIKILGYLKAKLNDKQALLGRKIQSSSRVNVNLANDLNLPWISGCTIMPSGHTVSCDRKNNKIKLLNTTSVLQETLTLPDQPWDVSIIDDNNVIVTLPEKMQIHYIQMLPQMKAGRVIQLDKNCWGVEVSGDKIYTTCHDNPGKGEVRILSLDGTMLESLGIKQDGSYMFTSPFYTTVSPSGRKIYVSDAKTSMVTCMTVDGNIIYEYKDDQLGTPYGLYVDGGDNVFVCGRHPSKVQPITAGGSKYETLLSARDDLREIYSVTYRDNDDTFVTGCRDRNKVHLFKLAK